MNEREKLIADLKELLTRTIYPLDAINVSRAIAALSEQGEPVATVHVVRRSHGVVDTATRFFNTDQFEDGLNNLYARPQPLQGWVNGRILLVEAIARGWCSPKNSHKEMDCDLVEAIADEIEAAQDK